jgi:hypothetical protein
MTRGRIRRAQLVSPFGVGAMTVLVDGTSVITAGLDHWYETDEIANLQLEEFKVEEWRLARRLRVSHFRLPPDHRTPFRGGGVQPNMRLTVPVLRFPCWGFCPYCKRLQERPLEFADRQRCPDPKHQGRSRSGKGPVMAQVPFVVICDAGHLSDFPWHEWVHRSLQPVCRGTLRLKSRGGGSLAGQVVRCDQCEQERPLEGVTTATKSEGVETTILTKTLDPGSEFTCRGWRPWLADPGDGSCGQAVRAALRGASNVYFAIVESSIYLPRHSSSLPTELVELLRSPEMAGKIRLLQSLDLVDVEHVRKADDNGLLAPYGDDVLEQAISQVLLGEEPRQESETGELESEVEWRRPEYERLREPSDHPDLVITPARSADGQGMAGFSRIRLVEKMRETRALRGFTRVHDRGLKVTDGKALLRRTLLPPDRDWLPAYVVRGEGIYLELDEERLGGWEERDDVRLRAATIERRYAALREGRGFREKLLPPRFILIHTLAHLLINQLVFESGYSSASLRERLYASEGPASPSAGMLLYTAAGDSEGTMGGLVRMGQPGALERVVDAALAAAEWCSSDPVCMEVGAAGQGPDSCNLAACHGCALLPETACEEYNRFLDRGLVVGTLDNPSLGYFSST